MRFTIYKYLYKMGTKYSAISRVQTVWQNKHTWYYVIESWNTRLPLNEKFCSKIMNQSILNCYKSTSMSQKMTSHLRTSAIQVAAPVLLLLRFWTGLHHVLLLQPYYHPWKHMLKCQHPYSWSKHNVLNLQYLVICKSLEVPRGILSCLCAFWSYYLKRNLAFWLQQN